MISSAVTVVEPPQHVVRHLARWMSAYCEPGAAVLNIGAGEDRSGALTPLVRRAPHLVGVDPHEAIHRNESLDEQHQMSLEEFAADHQREFDLAFAVFVLEHVDEPAAFAQACERVLKPGGSLFALTLNVLQYFGAMTWALSRMGLSDHVLELLKGHDEVHDHHFPPEYRLNSVRSVSRYFEGAGFDSVEFRCYDAAERYQWYLPPGLRWFSTAYNRMAYAVGSPSLMGHLAFRAVK